MLVAAQQLPDLFAAGRYHSSSRSSHRIHVNPTVLPDVYLGEVQALESAFTVIAGTNCTLLIFIVSSLELNSLLKSAPSELQPPAFVC